MSVGHPYTRHCCGNAVFPIAPAVMMHGVGGGFRAPIPPVLSMVTGKVSYNDYNGRELLNRWIDHPQRLWDVICEILASGIEVMVHVGRDPNLIPATFKRLSDNVLTQLQGRSLNSLSMRAMSALPAAPGWPNFSRLAPALLRAPYLEHVIVEDWLLAQQVK